MEKLFTLIVGIVLLTACSYEEREISEEVLPVADGQSIKTEKITDLSAYHIHRPSGFLKSGSELIVGDYMNTNNVYRIDLEAGITEGTLPRVRTRSGRAVIFGSLSSDGRGGWTALEALTGKMVNAPSLLTRAGGENSIQLPEEQRHLWAVRAGNYIVATGIYAEGRYMLYSPDDGRVSYGVEYPEHSLSADLSEREKSFLYASNVLKARPDGEAFVCADMYSGVLDICRIEGGEVSLTKRLTYHLPRVQFYKNGDWPRVVYSKDNRFGFTDVCVTDECIYALYSGQTYRAEKKNFQHCRTLIEIGWDGTVRSTRSLDASLTHLAYDAQEKSLYGIAWTPSATLVRLTIN